MAKRFKHTIITKAGNKGHLDTKLSTVNDAIELPDIPVGEIVNPPIRVEVEDSIESAFITKGSSKTASFKRKGDVGTPVRLELLAGESTIYVSNTHNVGEWVASLDTSAGTGTNIPLSVRIKYSNGEVVRNPVYFADSTRTAFYVLREQITTAPPTTVISRTIYLTVALVNAEGITPTITIKGSDGTGNISNFTESTRQLSRYVSAPYIEWSVTDPSGTYLPSSGAETSYSDLTKNIYLQKNTQYADLRIVVSGLVNTSPVTFTIAGNEYYGTQSTSTNTTIGPIRIPHGTYNITADRSGASSISNLVVNGDKTVFFTFQSERTNKFLEMYANVPVTFVIATSEGVILYKSPYPMYKEKVTEDTVWNGKTVLSPYPNEPLSVSVEAPGYSQVSDQSFLVGQVYPRFTLTQSIPDTTTREINVSRVETYYADYLSNSRAGVDYPVGTRGNASDRAWHVEKPNSTNAYSTYFIMENLSTPAGYVVESATLYYTITSGSSTYVSSFTGKADYEANNPDDNDVHIYQVGTGFQGMAMRPASMEPAPIAKDIVYPFTRLESYVGNRSVNLDTSRLVKDGVNVLNILNPKFMNQTSTQIRAAMNLPITQANGMSITGMKIVVNYRRQ